MTTTTLTRSDHEIQRAVEAQLSWTPIVDEAGIGVSVEDGAVTLSGDVDTLQERIAATKAALSVRGVSVVADELRVHPHTSARIATTDSDIAAALHRAFEWSTDVPPTVKAEVKNHIVTLTGEVQWNYQRDAARRVAEHTRGVYGVGNMITLFKRPSATDVAERIRNAMARTAALDAKAVTVTSAGTTVTLTGTVRSFAERRQAGLAAWSSPHVTDVHNNLIVKSD